MTHAKSRTVVTGESAVGWASGLERGIDDLIYLARVVSADELSGEVAEVAGMFEGEDAIIYLADLQQRVLVPFLGSRAHRHDEYLHALGIDASVADRAFRQMRRLTQSASTRAAADHLRVWLPLLNGSERLGVLGLTLPAAALEDNRVTARLHRFSSLVAELIVVKILHGDSIVRVRRTSEMTLAAEIQWSLPPPLTFVTTR